MMGHNLKHFALCSAVAFSRRIGNNSGLAFAQGTPCTVAGDLSATSIQYLQGSKHWHTRRIQCFKEERERKVFTYNWRKLRTSVF